MANTYRIPLILLTSLFFLWGFAHSILDVLNKHFQDVLVISKARSALVQTVLYGGYFLMALPAGKFISRFGYRAGVLAGLLLYGLGALLFIPAESIMSFNYFLFSLFVIGCGLTFLETAANPYVTELGPRETGAARLNLSQSFNGLGWILGPMAGGLLAFKSDGSHGKISLAYAVIGTVVLLVALLFYRVRLPRLPYEEQPAPAKEGTKGLWQDKPFIFGVIALFFYVGAQTGINSFFINFVTESRPDITARQASLMLSIGGMGLFMSGRFMGSWLLRKASPGKVLFWVAFAATACMALVIPAWGYGSIAALIACYLCEAIMFPTIFALSIRNLGPLTKIGSSFLIMAIVGGAITPVLMGWLGASRMGVGFVVPLVCFIVIMAYARYQSKSMEPLIAPKG